MKKWHPDKWTKNPSLLGEAKSKFQQIQEAYSGSFFFLILKFIYMIFVFHVWFWIQCFFFWTVLSDEGKRTLYDVGLYDPAEEEEEVSELVGSFEHEPTIRPTHRWLVRYFLQLIIWSELLVELFRQSIHWVIDQTLSLSIIFERVTGWILTSTVYFSWTLGWNCCNPALITPSLCLSHPNFPKYLYTSTWPFMTPWVMFNTLTISYLKGVIGWIFTSIGDSRRLLGEIVVIELW